MCGFVPEGVREVKHSGLDVDMECVDHLRVFARAAADIVILDATIAAAFCLHVMTWSSCGGLERVDERAGARVGQGFGQ